MATTDYYYTIWKVTLKTDKTVQEVELPEGAEVLYVREQFNEIALWFRCNPEAPKVPRPFTLVGTGGAAPASHDSRYLGTALLDGGLFIVHVFEPLQTV